MVFIIHIKPLDFLKYIAIITLTQERTKMNQKSLDNLKPFTSARSREEARIAGQKGGVASGEARREKKRMLQALEYVLNSPVAKDEQLFGDKTTQLMLGMHAISEKMKSGDVKAAEFIRDLIGEKPDMNINVKDIKTVPYEYSPKESEDDD
jgi:hypothetical protein